MSETKLDSSDCSAEAICPDCKGEPWLHDPRADDNDFWYWHCECGWTSPFMWATLNDAYDWMGEQNGKEIRHERNTTPRKRA